jgi:hypothetical protein
MVRWSSLILPIVIAVMGLLVALGTGVGIAYAVFEPPTSQARAQVEQRGARIAELEETLKARNQRIEELLLQQADMKLEIAGADVRLEAVKANLDGEETLVQKARADALEADTLVSHRDERIAELESEVADLTLIQDRFISYGEAMAPLDPDRLLLVELRKDSPNDREAAEEYWEGIKKLAVKSDPSLGPKADRVLRLIPSYFEYIDAAAEAETCEGVFDAYFTSGVIDYFNVESDFRRDLFLVLINRIDSLIILTEEDADPVLS